MNRLNAKESVKQPSNSLIQALLSLVPYSRLAYFNANDFGKNVYEMAQRYENRFTQMVATSSIPQSLCLSCYYHTFKQFKMDAHQIQHMLTRVEAMYDIFFALANEAEDEGDFGTLHNILAILGWLSDTREFLEEIFICLKTNQQMARRRGVSTMAQRLRTIEFESTKYKYKLLSRLGEGGFADIYEAHCVPSNNHHEYLQNDACKIALKIQYNKNETATTIIEREVLLLARKSNCRYIPRILDYGIIPELNDSVGNPLSSKPFISMEMKGRDLHSIRAEQGWKFPFIIAVQAGIGSLEALRELHEICGYVSCDVNPRNFLARNMENIREICIIDFGLSRKHIDAEGKLITTNEKVAWCIGTKRYMSLQAHQREELTTKDDLESWFYMLVELTKGFLPWTSIKDINDIYNCKLKTREKRKLHKSCPKEYRKILKMIDTMAEFPDYDQILNILNDILKNVTFYSEKFTCFKNY